MTSTKRWTFLARFSIPMAGLIATALLAYLKFSHPYRYLRVMEALIQWPSDAPFRDWAVTPAALSCWARGVIVYLPNDCSPLFNYSPVFLLLPAPPGGPFWTIVFGFSIALFFFGSLALLAPPRTRVEYAVRLLATLSSSVALGIERGNVDVILFILLLAASRLIAQRNAIGIAGYGIVVAAALLKFYPAAGLFLLLRERPARFIAICLLALAAATWLILGFWEPLRIIFSNLPADNDWTVEFNGKTLPQELSRAIAGVVSGGRHSDTIAAVLRLLLIVLLVGAGATTCWFSAARGTTLPDAPAVLLPMVMGAVVTLFCFVLGQNYLYRGVYLLPVLAGLFAFARAAPAPVGGAVKTCAAVIAILLWMPFIRWCVVQLGLWDHGSARWGLWLVYQLAWWSIAVVLCAILFAYLARSHMGGMALRTILPARLFTPAGSAISRG